ncbi:hypothetical protein AgCh_020451 [Apium graveolens]
MNRTKLPIRERIGNVPQLSGSVEAAVAETLFIAIGKLKTTPSTLAFIAVQRQTAASKSRKPSKILQHGVVGGIPIVLPMDLPSISVQTPNLRTSFGHVFLLVSFGVGVAGSVGGYGNIGVTGRSGIGVVGSIGGNGKIGGIGVPGKYGGVSGSMGEPGNEGGHGSLPVLQLMTEVKKKNNKTMRRTGDIKVFEKAIYKCVCVREQC